MAAFNFDDYDYEESGDRFTLASILNWTGAFLSLVLIAGLATWGWKLWVRDVSGVPVVRALEGPMRVTPADPGGLASEYQGLTVNRIAEERTEESMADRVVLAPQPSILNEEEDLAMAELQPVEVPLPEAEVALAPEVLPLSEESGVSEEIVTLAPLAEEDGVLEDETVAVVPAPAFPTDEETAATEEPQRSGTDLAVALALGLADESAAEDVAAVVAKPGVPIVTPRPLIRPQNLQAVSYRPDAAGEIDAASIPQGTRLVQLGAYGSREDAIEAWEKSATLFGAYMAGKERVIEEAQTGGRTFYRLRAMGFSNLQDARRFCSVLVSDGANCIPVVQQ